MCRFRRESDRWAWLLRQLEEISQLASVPSPTWENFTSFLDYLHVNRIAISYYIYHRTRLIYYCRLGPMNTAPRWLDYYWVFRYVRVCCCTSTTSCVRMSLNCTTIESLDKFTAHNPGLLTFVLWNLTLLLGLFTLCRSTAMFTKSLNSFFLRFEISTGSVVSLMSHCLCSVLLMFWLWNT